MQVNDSFLARPFNAVLNIYHIVQHRNLSRFLTYFSSSFHILVRIKRYGLPNITNRSVFVTGFCVKQKSGSVFILDKFQGLKFKFEIMDDVRRLSNFAP